jgi:tetratricopeptide (TPR) repeat protein
MQRYRKMGEKFVWIYIMLASVCGAVHADSGAVYYDLGVFSFEAGDYREAENFLTKALAEKPDDAYAQFYLARTYLKQERFAEAEPLFHSAAALDPGIHGLSYEMGVLYQNMGKHDRALAAFEKVLIEEPDHVTALYHAGTSQFMLEQYRSAIDYLARAVDLSESVRPTAAYYAGICHFRLSEFAQALPQFDYAASAADTITLRQDAEQWARITRAQLGREKPWRLYARAGWLYDDNVQLSPPDSQQYPELKKEDDHAAALFFSGRYVMAATDSLDVGLGYSHYQTFYQDFDNYNLIGGIGELFSEYRFQQFTFGLAYIPAYYWVDTDSYLMQHQVRPEVRYRVSDTDEVGFVYRYARNNFFTDARRDGHAHEFVLNYLREIEQFDGYAFCGVGYQDSTASDPDEYFTEMTARVGVSAGFFERFRIRIQGDCNDKNYDNRDSFHKIKREDARYGVSAVLSWRPPIEWLELSLEYTHTRNDANIDAYDYRRNTVGLFLAADF